MEVSQQGIKLIEGFEGLFLNAYKDQAGIWTIGYGTIKYPNGSTVKKGDSCTIEDAERWLAFEVGEKCSELNRVLDRLNFKLTQNQFDALASFIYNVGIGKCYPGTTMGDAINLKSPLKIADAFLVYKMYSWFKIKRVSAGLERRRKIEKAMFEGKSNEGNNS